MINLQSCLLSDQSESTKGGRFYGVALQGTLDDLHHAYCRIMEQSTKPGSELQVYYHRIGEVECRVPIFNPRRELTYLVVMSPKSDVVLDQLMLVPLHDDYPLTRYEYRVMQYLDKPSQVRVWRVGP